MKKKILLLSILVVVFVMITTACGNTKKTEVQPTLTPEEQEIQKKNEIVALFDTSEKYTFEDAKQVDAYYTGKMTMKMDGAENDFNSSKTIKINITDESTQFYFNSSEYGASDPSTTIMFYEGNDGYYCKDASKFTKEMSFEDFQEFYNDIINPDDMPEKDFGYANYQDFTFDELSDKYIGKFSNPDEKIKNYFTESLKESMEDETTIIESFTINSLLEEITINKNGYIEKSTSTIDFNVEMKEKGKDEIKVVNFKYIENVTINKINEKVDITIPTDLTSYVSADNILLVAKYDDKIDDFMYVNTYGKSNINVTSEYKFGGTEDAKLRNEIKLAYEYNDDYEITSYAEQGKQILDGEEFNYSENYKDGVVHHKDDTEETSSEISSEEIDAYISSLVRGHFYSENFEKITTGNLGTGNVLTADIKEIDVSNIAYGAISSVYSNADELWEAINDVECDSYVATYAFDDNDNIISIAYKIDIVLSTDDGEVTLKYTYTVERTQI